MSDTAGTFLLPGQQGTPRPCGAADTGHPMAVTPEHAGPPRPACGARWKNNLLFLGKATPLPKEMLPAPCTAWPGGQLPGPARRAGNKSPLCGSPSAAAAPSPTCSTAGSAPELPAATKGLGTGVMPAAAAPAPTVACPHATATGPSSPGCGAHAGRVCHRCQPSAWSLPGTEYRFFPLIFQVFFHTCRSESPSSSGDN